MNARRIFGFGLGLLLAVAPAASAQYPSSAPVSATTPGAAMLAPGLMVPQAAPPAAQPPRGSRVTAAPVMPDDPQTPAPAAPTPAVGRFGPGLLSPKGQLINVRIEFTITDQLGSKPPTKKVMTLTVADRESGRIRTDTTIRLNVPGSPTGFTYDRVPLSVDVQPTVDANRIRLEFSLEYNLFPESDPAKPEGGPLGKTSVSERLSAILESGVPLTIAQSSDAMSDRKLTVEVKATLLK
jgi:hypothetical protein